MATPASWKPGQSGNPHGRPKKKRALTQALESSVNRVVELSDGTRINGKRYLAKLAFDAITTGIITLANGKTLELSPDDMLMFWKFYFSQIDGPPPQKLEHSGEGGNPIETNIFIKGVDYRSAIANLAPGSMGDSDTPGQDQSIIDGQEMG